MANVFGMRGTGDWQTNEDPENWRQMILFLYPNGDTIVTAITSMLRSSDIMNYKHNWWEYQYPDRAGAITGLFTDAGLGSAYAGGSAAAGLNLFVQVAQAVAAEVSVGKVVQLVDTDRFFDSRVSCLVTGRLLNGANSYIAVQTLEAEGSNDLSNADYVMVTGNVNAQGALPPEALHRKPVQKTSYTSIIRNVLNMSRTARKTGTLRTGDPYQEAIRQTLEDHATDIEEQLLTGYGFDTTNAQGEVLSGMQGITTEITANGTSGENVDDFRYSDTSFNGKNWLDSDGGKVWFGQRIRDIYSRGSDTKLWLCGSGALDGINQIAETYGTINIQPQQTDYGIKVGEWHSPHGVALFKRHPRFSQFDVRNYWMVAIEPERLGTLIFQDTIFKEDMSETENTGSGRDGKREEFLTELSMEYPFLADTGGFLDGVGLNNPA